MYFVSYGRLYYIIDQEPGTDNLLIEDCITLEQNWLAMEKSDLYSNLRVVNH